MPAPEVVEKMRAGVYMPEPGRSSTTPRTWRTCTTCSRTTSSRRSRPPWCCAPTRSASAGDGQRAQLQAHAEPAEHLPRGGQAAARQLPTGPVRATAESRRVSPQEGWDTGVTNGRTLPAPRLEARHHPRAAASSSEARPVRSWARCPVRRSLQRSRCPRSCSRTTNCFDRRRRFHEFQRLRGISVQPRRSAATGSSAPAEQRRTRRRRRPRVE